MIQTDQHLISFSAAASALNRNSTQSAASLPSTQRMDQSIRVDGRNLSALRIPLRGLFFRQLLIHGTSIGRLTAKKMSSQAEPLASNISIARASKIELLHAWP